MSAPKQPIIVPVLNRLSRICKAGEVIEGKFDGTPLIGVHHVATQSGSFCRISVLHLESEITKWKSAVQALYKVPLSELQVKVIVATEDEARLKKALSATEFAQLTIAKFSRTEALECFFYPDSGRLRVAELDKLVQMPEPIRLSKPTELRGKKRVLIVDDSKTIRQILRKIIESSPHLEVAGEVDRPSAVEKAIVDLKPDVMTLDIRMPEMTGVELLRRMFPARFIPTVMISSLSIDEGHEVLDALEIGAVDYVQKPDASEIASITPIIHEKLISAAGVRGTTKMRTSRSGSVEPSLLVRTASTAKFIAIGASTGGTEAIKSILTCLPENIPPIGIVQHIPPHFSAAFANRLNELCRFEVREARDGDEFRPGLALVAPGGRHLEIVRRGQKFVARIHDGPTVNRFKPSVDVLFSSVAKVVGRGANGVILTGMGSDGAKGLLEMRKAGAFTIAQDEESCVVFGMPRAAIELGAAQLVKHLDDISSAMLVRPAAA